MSGEQLASALLSAYLEQFDVSAVMEEEGEQERQQDVNEMEAEEEHEQPMLSTEDRAWRVVLNHIKDHDIKGFNETAEREGTYFVSVEGITSIVTVSVDPKLLYVKFRFPLSVPRNKRTSMAELVARINYGLLLGSFHLDMNEGKIDFCHANAIGDGLTDPVISEIILASRSMLARFSTKFCCLLYQDKAAAQILEPQTVPNLFGL